MRGYILFLLFLLFGLTTGYSQNKITATSEISIKGTSNLHNWEVNSKSGSINADMKIDSGHVSEIKSLELKVSVTTLKSTKGAVMDKNMYQALKAGEFPYITFNLLSITKILKTVWVDEIIATGYLEIAGIRKIIELTVYAKTNTSQGTNFNLSKKIKMSDYGIKPPTALFGLLKTGNEIDIEIKFSVK
jgi:hypothetical protein